MMLGDGRVIGSLSSVSLEFGDRFGWWLASVSTVAPYPHAPPRQATPPKLPSPLTGHLAVSRLFHTKHDYRGHLARRPTRETPKD